MENKYCGKCGESNKPRSVVCSACGEVLGNAEVGMKTSDYGNKMNNFGVILIVFIILFLVFGIYESITLKDSLSKVSLGAEEYLYTIKDNKKITIKNGTVWAQTVINDVNGNIKKLSLVFQKQIKFYQLYNVVYRAIILTLMPFLLILFFLKKKIFKICIIIFSCITVSLVFINGVITNMIQIIKYIYDAQGMNISGDLLWYCIATFIIIMYFQKSEKVYYIFTK
ncbi:MAG TPA: zinc ribbon domain-containing protein [Pseudobacteroides sp.]|uniref:zinc ribbon domain-containing protein n=1 Tax=Pseudobacteroides sp. TaxID=1968840 RepID=UPI002F92203C